VYEKDVLRTVSSFFDMHSKINELFSFQEILTCTMLLSDNGLDEETPESDAQDLTDADRTIFGTVSSGDGDIDDIRLLVVVVISEGHDEVVASK